MSAVQAHADAGGPVLGICNGFQVLCEAGLLPGALMRNDRLTFASLPVRVRVETGLLQQHRPGPSVGLQRLSLTSLEVEREHQLRPEPFPQGVVLRQPQQLRHDLLGQDAPVGFLQVQLDGRQRVYRAQDGRAHFLDRAKLVADFRAVSTVLRPTAAVSTTATFVIEDGRPGARRA